MMDVFDTIGAQVEQLHQQWMNHPPRWIVRLDDIMSGQPWCAICGCTENAACDPPCSWAGEGADEHGQPIGVICTTCLPVIQTTWNPPIFQPGILPFPRDLSIELAL